MAIRVAINGFGRIGRQVLQVGINDPAIEWVCINDLTEPKNCAYLLKYDSVYGQFPGTISSDDKSITVNGKRIQWIKEKDPAKLPWKDLRIDVVLDCSGLFTKREKAQLHLQAGAKKVLISAPGTGVDITVVKGVNEHLYDPAKHHIISNASCTTNCLAPIVKVLHDNFSIQQGFMVTAHSYTADQRLVDSIHENDLRRGRAAAQSIVPTSTGAAKTVAEVIPALKGKLDGFAWRVPVLCGSIVQFCCTVDKPTSAEHVNWLFQEVAKFHLKGIIEYTDEALVSRDILRNPHSCIFDSSMTNVLGPMITVSGWYDNEWGYSNRMVDILKTLVR